MSFDPKNLPDERPPSLDAQGFRNFIHPAEVKGFFRKWRTAVYAFLIFLFLVVPWTTYQGKQTILLDLAQREFTFFNSTFYAHDGPLIFFPLFIFVVTLVYITSVFGRAWCGWACPQTVFIDFIYRRIETWIEGNHIKRRKLDAAPMDLNKFIKKSIKWFLFFIVSAHIAHSFTAYFVGAKSLVWITLGSPLEHWALFLFVQFMTLLFLFDFGWFREQFCIIMCPYGRFQSVLMGKDSLAVLYDEKRGEPRGKKSEGDCIDCYKCVNVCPTGIDIRKGVQLECIACTACIDACDDVMEKIKKPKGLIRYSSVAEIDEGKKTNPFNIRSSIYLAVLVGLISVFTIILTRRQPVEIKALRATSAPFQKINENGKTLILNHFRIHLINQSNEVKELRILKSDPKFSIIAPLFPVNIEPGESSWAHVFIKAPVELFKEQKFIKYELNIEGGVKKTVPLKLLGP